MCKNQEKIFFTIWPFHGKRQKFVRIGELASAASDSVAKNCRIDLFINSDTMLNHDALWFI